MKGAGFRSRAAGRGVEIADWFRSGAGLKPVGVWPFEARRVRRAFLPTMGKGRLTHPHLERQDFR